MDEREREMGNTAIDLKMNIVMKHMGISIGMYCVYLRALKSLYMVYLLSNAI